MLHPLQLRLLSAHDLFQCKRQHVVPNVTVVPPNFVSTPQAVVFCFVRAFCTDEKNSPTPPITAVVRIALLTASLKTYGAASGRIASLYRPGATPDGDAIMKMVMFRITNTHVHEWFGERFHYWLQRV